MKLIGLQLPEKAVKGAKSVGFKIHEAVLW